MMNLDFLTDITIEAVKKPTKTKKVSAPKLPESADLRVFGSGRVYPSETFAKEGNLEFQGRTVLEDGTLSPVMGNGLDIFSSKKWGMIAGKLPSELIFVSTAPKSEAKVDMWASTKYDKVTGEPGSSVFTQGASTFSKTILVDMLADIYGIDWSIVSYVDLTVSRENVIASPDGIYHLPKIVSGGAHKGEDTYVRRENITICPLVITHTEMQETAPVMDPAEPAVMDKAIADATEPVAKTEAPDEDWAAKLGQS